MVPEHLYNANLLYRVASGAYLIYYLLEHRSLLPGHYRAPLVVVDNVHSKWASNSTSCSSPWSAQQSSK